MRSGAVLGTTQNHILTGKENLITLFGTLIT